MRNGLRVYQASGDVVVIRDDGVVDHAPYGVFPAYLDQLARDSLTEIEREADRLRREQA